MNTESGRRYGHVRAKICPDTRREPHSTVRSKRSDRQRGIVDYATNWSATFGRFIFVLDRIPMPLR